MLLYIYFESLCKVIRISQFLWWYLCEKINKFSSRMISLKISFFKSLSIIKVSTAPFSVYRILTPVRVYNYDFLQGK